eukprot:TRINITY_DN42247_c0_g1_i2.p1 TRINITY_DN42247_c0_g1~~TRINITY_DN42247_c0_g1_i2.p1  ORF type:complete len:557 (+),score=91.44 TRINITY_DN42247_c0_g1_i2:392-2062(+)
MGQPPVLGAVAAANDATGSDYPSYPVMDAEGNGHASSPTGKSIHSNDNIYTSKAAPPMLFDEATANKLGEAAALGPEDAPVFVEIPESPSSPNAASPSHLNSGQSASGNDLSANIRCWLETRVDSESEGKDSMDSEGLEELMEKTNGPRRRVQELLANNFFDISVGLVILSNAITIGVETSVKSGGNPIPLWLFWLEKFYLFVYTFELVMRLYGFRLRAFDSSWVRFDCFLVVCGIVDEALQLTGLDDGGSGILEKILLVRLLRLARLARLVRLMVRFRVLWLLVQGLLHSLNTLIWTFVIILILLYMFSILAMELVKPDENASERYNDIVHEYFSDLLNCLLTLLQGLTLDSMGNIYRPIILEKPYMFFYFMAFILIVSIALMNLITALMVESAMTQAQGDREANKAYMALKRKKMIGELQILFRRLDADGSGLIDFDELMSADKDVKDRLWQLLQSNDPDELHHIFKTLDYDNSGAVGIDEFCEGLMRIQDGKPMEMTCIMKQCSDILHNARETMQMLQVQFDPTRTLSGAAVGRHDSRRALAATASPGGPGSP